MITIQLIVVMNWHRLFFLAQPSRERLRISGNVHQKYKRWLFDAPQVLNLLRPSVLVQILDAAYGHQLRHDYNLQQVFHHFQQPTPNQKAHRLLLMLA